MTLVLSVIFVLAGILIVVFARRIAEFVRTRVLSGRPVTLVPSTAREFRLIGAVWILISAIWVAVALLTI